MADPNTNPAGPFPTPQAVLHWLKPRLPPDTITLWGTKPGTKNVHNLFLELSQGQSTLSNPSPPLRSSRLSNYLLHLSNSSQPLRSSRLSNSSPPLRSLHLILVNVIINYGDDNKKFLHKSQQLLSDGTMRPCSRLLTGKMKAGEAVEAAVIRVTREQLGSVLGTRSTEEVVRIFPGSCNINEVKRESGSYPGLMSRYVVHEVDAMVEGLPDSEFVTVEEYEDCGGLMDLLKKVVHVKRHYWRWTN